MASPVAVVVASPAASAASRKRKDVPAAVPAPFVVSPVAAAPAKTVVSAPVAAPEPSPVPVKKAKTR